MAPITIETARGPARAQLQLPAPGTARAALALGHGAGGGIAAPDLKAASQAALSEGFAVALIEQPYRVAGRRSPAPAHHLDDAWTTVITRLAERELAGLPMVCGGRSSGARVACRTASATAAIGVVCLAFPLVAPQRAQASSLAASRLPELDAVTVPVLVVQGTGDRFGMPPSAPTRTVVPVKGDHGLKTDLAAVGEAVAVWLSLLLVMTAPG
jgi:predicted alpha/beta-hydrolase family hydrolase